MNQLKKLFPFIREREEILSEINQTSNLSTIFYTWSLEERERFLDICTGAKGFKILQDPIFKEVLNPEYTPARLENLLSSILGQTVKILQILPNDTVRIASETTLLITDIIVELSDESIVNVEVQRIGYKFPAQRAACYSADMLLRQYKRARNKQGEKFVYKDIKSVYTIVFFEHSPAEFHAYPSLYIHNFEQKSDTGIKMNLLQKYTFICLDNFQKCSNNKNIDNRLEAWLTFFTTEDSLQVKKLITLYPEFKSMYDTIYEMCLNTEKVMNMFSKELQILDENTVQYMMDEMQEEIDALGIELEERKRLLCETTNELKHSEDALKHSEDALKQSEDALKHSEDALKHSEDALKQSEDALKQSEDALKQSKQELAQSKKLLEEKDDIIRQLQAQLSIQ